MFNYADAYGNIRLAYIDSAHKISTSPKVKKEASAIGGEIGINTATYHGVGFHITSYISQNLEFANPNKNDLNEDFFNTDRDSFIYISEASINYSNDFVYSKLGRIKVETPYANSDDIRMAPNTFEGAWANIDYTDKLKTQIMFINRWAGYDSQDEDAGLSQDTFKSLVNENAFGMATISLTYEYAPESEISLWYNFIDEMSSIVYTEVVGVVPLGDDVLFNYGVQASHMEELKSSNVAGDVLGVMSILSYKGVSIAGAYNIALVEDGKYITNGFGGGPYYTSLDEATIEAISEAVRKDSEAFRLGAGYEFSNFGLNGLVLEGVYGELYGSVHTLREIDAIITYEIRENLSFEAIYTNYEADVDNNTFDRYLVRMNYAF